MADKERKQQKKRKERRKERIMEEKRNELLEYILSLTPEKVEKIVQRLPEITAALAEAEAKKEEAVAS